MQSAIPAYVVIDPKGELIKRLSQLDIFNPDDGLLRNALVIVDPFQEPALNLFQLTGGNRAQIVSNFSYIFSTSNQRLTGKQATCFTFCVDLLFNIPGANLFTFLDLLDDRTKVSPQGNPVFSDAVRHFPQGGAARRFFDVDFYNSNYATTREEIKTRIYELLKNDHLAAMFNAPERRLDITDCVQTGKIVLVNTRMVELKTAHQTLGRFIISLFVDAIQSRTKLPESEWHPAFLIIDEFQEFADEFKTPEMLRLIREYNGGAIIAHHNMFPTEFNDGIRSAISTNTRIKYASDPAGKDISYMASDMHCDPKFLTDACVKAPDRARFGCYYTGLPHPFVEEVPFGQIKTFPKMKLAQHARLMENNRAALSPKAPKTHEAPETEASLPAPSQPNTTSFGISPEPKREAAPDEPPERTNTASDRDDLINPHVGDHTEPATKWGDKK